MTTMEVPTGKAALIASVGGQRGYADWTRADHRFRRLLAEFIGTAGLTFMAAGGWFVGLGFGLWLVAARKIWIVLDKRDFF